MNPDRLRNYIHMDDDPRLKRTGRREKEPQSHAGHFGPTPRPSRNRPRIPYSMSLRKYFKPLER